jgi:hypothetical protein
VWCSLSGTFSSDISQISHSRRLAPPNLFNFGSSLVIKFDKTGFGPSKRPWIKTKKAVVPGFFCGKPAHYASSSGIFLCDSSHYSLRTGSCTTPRYGVPAGCSAAGGTSFPNMVRCDLPAKALVTRRLFGNYSIILIIPFVT